MMAGSGMGVWRCLGGGETEMGRKEVYGATGNGGKGEEK
jgi:hypothetical protein